MKLLFPNDEHAPVTLVDGTLVVGSAAECDVRLDGPGIAARHCELIGEDGQGRARPLSNDVATVLNGKQIVGEAAFKAGDLLLFGKIGCRVVATARAAAPPATRAPDPEPDDMGHTRVRMAMPKFLLRGVSGPTFGKVYAMVGAIAVGRSSESDICIPIDEISRHHAKLQSAAEGIVVEDLGSANGTYVNDQRVHTGTLLRPGDEVRFDTVRFLLMSPGQQESQQAAAAATRAAAPSTAGSNRTLWVVAVVIVALGIALAALRWFGLI